MTEIPNKLFDGPVVAASWNVSAVNTNPFEYWVTHPDPTYNMFMTGVQNFVDNPENDKPIFRIFSDRMFQSLYEEMNHCNVPHLNELSRFWTEEYRSRKAIDGFLKNPEIGVKRLASLPDRITNTIYLADGGVCLRPTVINAYDKPLPSMETWWVNWCEFMFRTNVQVSNEKNTTPCMIPSELSSFAWLQVFARKVSSPQPICSLIRPIPGGKYPAVSAEEQIASVPLQILCLAILDAVLLHIVAAVGSDIWQPVRLTLCQALIHSKQERTCSIIDSYREVEVLFIQVCGGM